VIIATVHYREATSSERSQVMFKVARNATKAAAQGRRWRSSRRKVKSVNTLVRRGT